MIETNIQNQKELFLKLEFFLLSWAAAVFSCIGKENKL